jgi:hypothetical protein
LSEAQIARSTGLDALAQSKLGSPARAIRVTLKKTRPAMAIIRLFISRPYMIGSTTTEWTAS